MPRPGVSPGGIRPSFGSGGGGIASHSRFVKSPPRQTRSTPDHRRRVLEVVDHPVDRPPLRPDRDRVEHQPEEACRRLRAREAGRRRGSAACRRRRGSRRASRAPGAPRADPLEHLGEDAARGVGEVEDHAERDEPVDELAPEPREAAALLGGAVRERVPAVPREPGHPHAKRVEDVRGPGLDAEALDALEREHETDPLAGLDEVEVRRRPRPARRRPAFSRSARWNDATIESASRSDPSGCTVTST